MRAEVGIENSRSKLTANAFRATAHSTTSVRAPSGNRQRDIHLYLERAIATTTRTVAILFMLGDGAALWVLHRESYDEVHRDLANVSLPLAEQTSRALQAIDNVLQDVVEDTAQGVRALDAAAPWHQWLQRRGTNFPQAVAFGIVDREGVLLAHSVRHPAPSISLAERDFFVAHRESMSRGAVIGAPIPGALQGRPVIPISRRLNPDAPTFVGMVAAGVDVQYFQALYEKLHLRENSAVTLLHRDGTVLATYPNDLVPITKAIAWNEVLAASEGSATHIATGPNREQVSWRARALSEFPILVVVSKDARSILRSWWQQAAWVGGGALTASLLSIALGMLLSRQLARARGLQRGLNDAERRWQFALEGAGHAVSDWDVTRGSVYRSSAFHEMLGYSRDELSDTTEALERLLHPDDLERFREARRNYLSTRVDSKPIRPWELEYRLRCKDGTYKWIANRGMTLTSDGQGRPGRIISTLTDVTDRKAAFAELERSHDELRTLNTAMESVREAERKRMARELHDDLGQQLAAMKMDVGTLKRSVQHEHEQLSLVTDRLEQLVNTAVSSSRRMIADLRPAALDELGLPAALQGLGQSFSSRYGIECELRADEDLETLNDTEATALYRITQEALNNVAKHAGASKVSVALARSNGSVMLSVQDNGKGMATVDRPTRGRESYGLIGMRERAAALGGKLRCTSGTDVGMTIEVTLPLEATR